MFKLARNGSLSTPRMPHSSWPGPSSVRRRYSGNAALPTRWRSAVDVESQWLLRWRQWLLRLNAPKVEWKQDWIASAWYRLQPQENTAEQWRHAGGSQCYQISCRSSRPWSDTGRPTDDVRPHFTNKTSLLFSSTSAAFGSLFTRSLFSWSLHLSSRVSTTATLCWPVYRRLHWHRCCEFSMPPFHWWTTTCPRYVGTQGAPLLPIAQQIEYKLCLLVHKLIVGQAPVYLKNLLTAVTDVPSRSALCEAMKGNFVVPRTRLKLEERAFSIAAPQAWNRLPADLKPLRSTPAFKCSLKTCLFRTAYNVWFLGLCIPLLLSNCSGFIVFLVCLTLKCVAVLFVGGALNQSLYLYLFLHTMFVT